MYQIEHGDRLSMGGDSVWLFLGGVRDWRSGTI